MNSVITDSNFETFGKENSKWVILTHEGVGMLPSLSNGVLSLEVTHARGANWHGELRYSPFPVQAGEHFQVTFSARARIPFTFSVWLGQQDTPYKSLVPEDNHFGEDLMTSEWQSFSHGWKPFLSEEKARLNFVLGPIDNTIEIKEVVLTRV